jgi:hypothetical protein
LQYWSVHDLAMWGDGADGAQAYDICKARNLVAEMVFILGRMGNNKEALSLIIAKLGDVQQAIDFAKEQNDQELWEDLISYSMTRPGTPTPANPAACHASVWVCGPRDASGFARLPLCVRVPVDVAVGD